MVVWWPRLLRRECSRPRRNCASGNSAAAQVMAVRLAVARSAFVQVARLGPARASDRPQRRIRRASALPHAGGQSLSRAGRWRVRCWWRRTARAPARTPTSCAARSPWRGSMPSHILTRVPGLRDSILDGAMSGERSRSSESSPGLSPTCQTAQRSGSLRRIRCFECVNSAQQGFPIPLSLSTNC